MERIYFGIKFHEKQCFDEKKIAAKMFLSPRVSAEHAVRILSLLAKGRITLEMVERTLQEGVDELKMWIATGTDIPSVFTSKLKAWAGIFGEPQSADYVYLEKNYGITRWDLFGDYTLQKKSKFTSPKELADYVKQYIKGQDSAIENLAVTIYMHLDSKRKHYVSRTKTHPLLIGPTGSGKSEMLRVFALACDECPVINLNCSDFLAEGWKGRHLSEIFAQALSEKCSIKDLEYSIIVLHEFDKITHYGQRIIGNNGTDADKDQQSNIMGLFDRGHCIYIESGFDNGTMTQKLTKLPVDNFLVVFDGAFDGLETIIKRRLHIGKTIGFTQTASADDNTEILSRVTDADLVEWGFMPELIGRIGEIVTVNPLSEETIYQILVSAKDSILQSHFDLCIKNNIKLDFSEGALRCLASETMKSGLGFRNANKLLYQTMKQIYFDCLGTDDSDKQRTIEVNREYVEKMLNLKQRA